MRQAGYPCTAGSRALMGSYPTASTACVTRLEAAGAIAIGRSNVPEFCYRGTTRNELYGQTGNPFAPDRSAGGSSGGAASALALGVGELALGSDGGGSIRIPASFCGTVGLKPSYGLVPRAPDGAGWLLLTHFGPLTRTVGDCARALAVHGRPRPARSALACRRSATTTWRPRASRAISRTCASPPPTTSATSASTARCGSASPRRSRRSPRQPARRSSRRTPGSPRRSTSGTTIACGDNSASEGPLLATGLVGDDARALIEAGHGSER